MSDEPAQRDFWSKLQIILMPIGGLFTALAVAMVGIIGSGMIDRRQTADTNARLYSEIMSKREESETSLRKDMLVSVIQSYLQPHVEGTGHARSEHRTARLQLQRFDQSQAAVSRSCTEYPRIDRRARA